MIVNYFWAAEITAKSQSIKQEWNSHMAGDMGNKIGACVLLLNSMIGAVRLPNTTHLPATFDTSAIKTIVEGLHLVYESYKVTTADKYILTLNRIINPDKINATNKGVPVLFVNGMAMHSEAWLLHKKPKLNLPVAYLLEGYDVWLGDQRGTIRSQKHINLSSNYNWHFWDFSFHETGVYDLPAFIDFILAHTHHRKLVYSGLSLGGCFYYVMCVERPEYQEKMYGGILWHPVGESASVYSMPWPLMANVMLGKQLLELKWSVGMGKAPPNNYLFRNTFYDICRVARFVAAKFAELSLGRGCEWEEDLCIQLALAIGGTSAKTMLHTIQLLRNGGIFSHYDHGPFGNLMKYGRHNPPIYNISKLRVFTALYSSDIDVYAPTRVVVPFSMKFSGLTYTCNIKGVCHGFPCLDPRVRPYVQDSIEVLNSMTGRTSYAKILSKQCYVPHPIRRP